MGNVRTFASYAAIKGKLIQGIEAQNINMTELKTKRDNSLIEILKTKKANGL